MIKHIIYILIEMIKHEIYILIEMINFLLYKFYIIAPIGGAWVPFFQHKWYSVFHSFSLLPLLTRQSVSQIRIIHTFHSSQDDRYLMTAPFCLDKQYLNSASSPFCSIHTFHMDFPIHVYMVVASSIQRIFQAIIFSKRLVISDCFLY